MVEGSAFREALVRFRFERSFRRGAGTRMRRACAPQLRAYSLMRRAVRASWIKPAILLFALIAPVWTIFWFRHNWVIGVLPLFVSHLLLLYPTFVSQSQWWGPVIRSFDTTRREVWITIDDGPTPAHTEKILDVLERHSARATFFVIGSRAAHSPQLIEEILRRGHMVANHTFTHPSGSFWCASPARIAAEIDQCDEILNGQLPRSELFFRAPAGLKNPFVHPALARRGKPLIGWTVRGLDTLRREPSTIAKAIKRKACSGAIVLLHEGHHLERSPDLSPRCIELTLEILASSGFAFVIPRREQLRVGFSGK